MTSITKGSHAIVIGASISGLLAARAVHEHFEHVTLLDRDFLSEKGCNRRAIPQGQHANTLAFGGWQALERLFPGVVRELVDNGAVECQLLRELRFFNEGLPFVRGYGDLRTLFLSRALLEGHVRDRVRRLSNVCIRDNVEAVELVARHGDVCGVRTRTRAANAVEQTLPADLVVDATGRSSRLDRWLHALGFEAPARERVSIDLRYTSCRYRRQPDQALGYTGMAVALAPPGRRSGFAFAQEGDQWIVTLAGYVGDAAEPTHAGMLDFARSLPNRALYELLCGAEPLVEPVQLRIPFFERRHYDRLKRFPARLIAIGDAVCSFDPSYGQGITVAAQQALALETHLQGRRLRWKRLFSEFAKLCDAPWAIAVGADLALAEVQGERSSMGTLIGRYVSALRRGAVYDPQLAQAFMRVAQLVEAPATLLAPKLVYRTLCANLITKRLRSRSFLDLAFLASRDAESMQSRIVP